jgi:hypothetical protein
VVAELPKDAETLETIIRLSKRKDFAILADLAAEMQEEWARKFARGMLKSTKAADQREIDEKRGFWDGINFILTRYPKIAERELEKLLETNKEGD